MPQKTLVTCIWLLLLALTLGSVLLGDFAPPGLLVTALVAGVIALKGGLVIRHFMELDGRHPRLRGTMNLYFVVVPGLILLVGVADALLSRQP